MPIGTPRHTSLRRAARDEALEVNMYRNPSPFTPCPPQVGAGCVVAGGVEYRGEVLVTKGQQQHATAK